MPIDSRRNTRNGTREKILKKESTTAVDIILNSTCTAKNRVAFKVGIISGRICLSDLFSWLKAE